MRRILLGAALGTLLVSPSLDAQQMFRRGDVDGDGIVGTAADVAPFLTYLFVGPFPCEAAADVNADSSINIQDLITIVGMMAGIEPTLPAPGPVDCGPDPTGGFLPCTFYDACDAPIPLPTSPDHILRFPEVDAVVGSTVAVPVVFDEFGPENDRISAYGFAVCHDPAQATLVDVQLGAAVPAPDYFDVQMHPTGWTAQLYPSFLGTGEPSGADNELFVAHYAVSTVGMVPLTICEGLSTPPTHLMLGIVEGAFGPGHHGYVPTTVDGAISVLEVPLLARGDANSDGGVDIADPIALLAMLFSGGPAPVCEDVADANDDGTLDIADPIAVLNALFDGGGGAIGGCAVDPTDDALECLLGNCP